MDDYKSLVIQGGTANAVRCSFQSTAERRFYGELKPYLGEVFRKLALQKESRIEQGHLMPDHLHIIGDDCIHDGPPALQGLV